MHTAERFPRRLPSSPERLELDGPEEDGYELVILELKELSEFFTHIRNIEKLFKGEVVGYRFHDLFDGFVLPHRSCSGKTAESFLAGERWSVSMAAYPRTHSLDWRGPRWFLADTTLVLLFPP